MGTSSFRPSDSASKTVRSKWPVKPDVLSTVDDLMKGYRKTVRENLGGIVEEHYPSLQHRGDNEYPKMLELSAKMTMVAHACTQIAGYPFDGRRQRISSLFGACCFIGDSFLDDFGEKESLEYLDRYELLLTKGWFDIRNEREQLFYVILSRLFAERDVLNTMLRQAVFSLFLAQKRDVELRANVSWFKALPRRSQLRLLRECARDRSGHAITILALFMVPELPLRIHHLIYLAGSLIMYIDDHGDCHSDRYCNRLTYMNQVKHPVRTLRKIFERSLSLLHQGLPEGLGQDLMIAFLYRYFITRLRKHKLEKDNAGSSWNVYG